MRTGNLVAMTAAAAATIAVTSLAATPGNAAPGNAALGNAALGNAALGNLARANGAAQALSAAETVALPTKSQLKLTVARGEKARPAQRKASLICGPAGGSHQHAREACAAIAAVGGDLSALHVGSGACTMQYDPVTVTAIGRWRGKAVQYQHTFSNACFLHLETGPVFSL